MKTSFLLLLNALLFACQLVAFESPRRDALAIVLVVDGLRPDSITPEITPNLNRLKTSGTWYSHAHSVFPTVTRVNTATIATGTLPSQHGIVSNSLYLPSRSSSVVSNGEYEHLLALAEQNGGRIVAPKTLHEYLQVAGISYIALSSGTTGNAVLLNPTAPYGNGSLINPGFEKTMRVAFPDTLNTTLLSRFGRPKPGDGDGPMLWVERVLREYVLDALHPKVIVNWMGRTDSAQHQYGVGSRPAIAALQLVDQQIGFLLARLRELNLEDKCNIIVTSDHGFDYEPSADVLAPVRQSGLAAGDVVVDAEGGASLLYIKEHDPEKISRLTASLQANRDTNAIFVPAKRPTAGAPKCAPGSIKGFAPGTFALELAGQCPTSGGPDMIVTYRWEDTPNPFGVPGTQIADGGPGAAARAPRNGHGGLNPYVTHSTLLASGRDFAVGKTVESPAGNQDIAPTLLAILGLPVPSMLDGRVLSEAMKDSRGVRNLKSSERRIRVSTGAYCAQIDVSYTGRHAYLNEARRCSATR
jgi:arylsulfatase A-like enzyme